MNNSDIIVVAGNVAFMRLLKRLSLQVRKSNSMMIGWLRLSGSLLFDHKDKSMR